jgi:hypothetical protein
VSVNRYGPSDATLPRKTHAAVAVAARHDEIRHPQIQAKNEGHSYRPTPPGTGGSQSWKAQAWETSAGEAISHPSPGGGKGISSLRQDALIPEGLMERRTGATNQRSGVDAGRASLFAFLHLWPGATHRGC